VVTGNELQTLLKSNDLNKALWPARLLCTAETCTVHCHDGLPHDLAGIRCGGQWVRCSTYPFLGMPVNLSTLQRSSVEHTRVRKVVRYLHHMQSRNVTLSVLQHAGVSAWLRWEEQTRLAALSLGGRRFGAVLITHASSQTFWR
jgi:hypothetical protein